MDLQLKGRRILITGASSGIGLATATMLAGEGARLALCARDEPRLREATAALAEITDVVTATCDVTDRQSVENFVSQAIDRLGGLDGVVCNAGRSLMSTVDDTSDDDIRTEFDLKIFGALNVVRAAKKALASSDSASIVVVNAILSRQPESRLAITAAARAGLLNLSRSLANDYAAENIRVNSVLLGLVDTGQWQRRHGDSDTELDFADWSAEIAADRGIGLGRFGTADELAFPITALLSPRSSYITGASLDVGGGVHRYV
ncbi:SDR family oxidoreductase [Rhodococcus sp. G-MC3]|uniref:SDR family oxidoreductase n=1 Tax=Rhodococcus sp. G-MC3 TaxID=3046209 RepID=UPI0024B9106E|nr:SDR family oxidoreductase [Rhodococcus sp. G-MC3]MDJ0395043.1 SDR family oxidoreductase [Rhodococcus sp. G-MC3]